MLGKGSGPPLQNILMKPKPVDVHKICIAIHQKGDANVHTAYTKKQKRTKNHPTQTNKLYNINTGSPKQNHLRQKKFLQKNP